jgi:DNA-binding response OmpR family regulator
MKKKILLVDDSKMIIMMEKMVLAREPYELLTAKDGREGLEMALEQRPDLILLDVVMPEMSGFDVLERLREEEATRSTPVIMVTTRGEAENIAAGQAAGCSDYVTKPIDSKELLAKVRSYLEG